VIDESWDLCPYCPAERGNAAMSIVRPSVVSPRLSTEHRNRLEAIEDVAPRTGGPALVSRTTAVPRVNFGESSKRRYVVGWLVGLNGTSRGESFPIRIGRNVIGRDPRSDVTVGDDQVSAHHADLVFRLDEKRYILMDHNSTNGTFVNEMEIEPRKDLSRLDVVRLGTYKFLFIPLEGFSWEDEGHSR